MRKRDIEKYEKYHKRLWNWLAQNPDANKQDWPEWEGNNGKIKYVTMHCFACYVECNLPGGGWMSCLACPIDSTGYSQRLCHSEKAPFSKWKQAKNRTTKTKWAKIIAELPWIVRK